MPLLAYNKSAAPITLAEAHPPVVLPASTAPPARGKAFDVTAELWPNATVDPANGRTGGLTSANFTALSAYTDVDFIWTHGAEYLTGALAPAGPSPGPHSHTAASTTAVNGATTATNQGTTATNQAATATNQNTATAQIVDLGVPDIADVDVIHAAILATDAGSPYNADTQPDVPRNLTCDFAALWDGGDITITGTDQFDSVVSEVFADNPGFQVVGTKIFKTIAALGIAKELVGSQAVAVTVGIGDKLGITPATAVKGVLLVDGVSKTGATWDGTYSAVTPDAADVPNSSKEYMVVVKTNHLHVQDSHNHTQDSHNHTQDSHNHTQTGHGHSVA